MASMHSCPALRKLQSDRDGEQDQERPLGNASKHSCRLAPLTHLSMSISFANCGGEAKASCAPSSLSLSLPLSCLLLLFIYRRLLDQASYLSLLHLAAIKFPCLGAY